MSLRLCMLLQHLLFHFHGARLPRHVTPLHALPHHRSADTLQRQTVAMTPTTFQPSICTIHTFHSINLLSRPRSHRRMVCSYCLTVSTAAHIVINTINTIACILGVMCSYNAENGHPSCANSQLLTGQLRAWSPDAIVSTDCGAINNLLGPPVNAPVR